MLSTPEPESLFALVQPVLNSADVVVGQGEAPFTDRGINTFNPISIMPCNPSNMRALPFAGFNVITLAGNHIWDWGAPGIEDTIAGLRNYGIAVTGAGMNIDEARKPAIIERRGTRFGFLNYNCVGPKESWASPDKPGCAYVYIITYYELDHPTPGGTPTIYTFAEPCSLQWMIDDIHKLRPLCDVLVVVFHKGLGMVSTKLAMYEQPMTYAAIDAGADLILGHHAHILKGIEQYKGKTIFHGLGNFITPTRITEKDSWTMQQFVSASRQKEVFGFEPDFEYPLPLWHPESRQTIIAKCIIEDGRISQVSYLPCLINKQAQPEILRNDERGRQVFDYMDKITKGAGLNVYYSWEGDEVVIHGQ